MFKNDTYQIELIEAYLSGTMSASERDKFEAQLAIDEELQEQLKLHQLTIATLQHHGQREDKAFNEAMESMTQDELRALLEQQREKHLDVAACAKPEVAADERRGVKQLITTIVILLVAFAAMAWWYMHR